MSRVLIRPRYHGLDHPDAAQRVLRAFDAGLDTYRIAEILQAPEPEVAQVLAEEREARRSCFRAGARRVAALRAAWAANDVDRHEIARRFGYSQAGSAGRVVRDHRRQPSGLLEVVR